MIVNPNAPSYISQYWKTVFNQHAKEKLQKYDNSVEDIRDFFTPMACTTDCVLHKKTYDILNLILYVTSIFIY